jgi:cation transport ATPase
MGEQMVRDILVVLFATTAGLTAAGILANFYRMVARKPETVLERVAYLAVMVVAGPSVLLENAAQSLRTKACSRTAFLLAAAVSAYWSFAVGLFVLNLSLTL